MNTKYFLPLLGIFTQLADARMDETRTELIARYGNPIKEDKSLNNLAFEKGGYHFEAVILDGVTQMLSITKTDRSALSMLEAKEFIQKNKGSFDYEDTIEPLLTGGDPNVRYKKTKDGQRWIALKPASGNPHDQEVSYQMITFWTAQTTKWLFRKAAETEQTKQNDQLNKVKKATEGF
jgi:hypothetical protein